MPISARAAQIRQRLGRVLLRAGLSRSGTLAGVIWKHEGRLHLRLRVVSSRDDALSIKRMEKAVEALPGVLWARVHARLGAIVVQTDPELADLPQLLAVVASVERSADSPRTPFAARHPERHPGDAVPLMRSVLEVAVDATSVGASAILRRRGIQPNVKGVDLALVLELVGNVPPVRKAIERVTSIAGTEVVLEVARALVQSLLQSEMGAGVAAMRRTLRVRELHARRNLWRRLEPELCATPESFGDRAVPYREGTWPSPSDPVRPYADHATIVSLILFFVGLVSTRDVVSASASIFAGLPKPARYGREAFAAHLGYLLARAGMLVIEPHTLRRLDRIDYVFIDGRLFSSAANDVAPLQAALKSAGVQLEIVAADSDPVQAMRSLQRARHGICAIGLGAWPGLVGADCGLAVLEPGRPVPWNVDIICPADMDGIAALVRGIAAARKVSEEGVLLSLVEASLAAGLATSGLKEKTTRRIMKVASVASILTVLNGVRHAHALGFNERSRASPSMTSTAPPWHSLAADEVLQRLDSSRRGLLEEQAAGRRQRPAPAPGQLAHFASLLADELKSPMTPVLALGAGLSLLTGSVLDAALIASVLGINTLIGGAEQYRAESALRALARVDARPTRVRRGQSTIVDVSPIFLVPGDILELLAGEIVPADCRILSACALEVDESSLTGESLPVTKDERAVDTPVVAERSSMLYEGTAIAAGQVVAVVVAIGEDTEARRAYLHAEVPRAMTGVEARLQELMKITAPLAAGAGLAVASAALLRGGRAKDVMASSIGLAVAAVPEGLPLLATMAQLAAAARLSKHGALVRDPRAVEVLGRVNVLCADKTGTLTAGRIALRLVSDGITCQKLDELGAAQREVLAVALRASPSSSDGEAPHLTDRALMEGAARAGVGSHDEFSGWQRLESVPFESRRAFHAAIAEHDEGMLLSVKGAPEVVLPQCTSWRRAGEALPLSSAQRQMLADEVDSLAGKGYRVLAVAERVTRSRTWAEGSQLQDLQFCGFLAFADPVRPSALAAVTDLRRAGVEVIMVTGDHPATAAAIAEELGLLNGHRVVTGVQLEQYGDAELDEVVANAAVFARVTPIQKVRIVAALQRSGKVVAMTGDGSNDAPAIRLANVGIALGGSSTSAARAAADMIVTDERIETIVQAILEGRALWASVRDALSLLVGGNIGEIAFNLLGGLMTGVVPLNTRQLLLVNLVTDSLPALAIVLRPPPDKTPEQLLREGPEASLGEALNRDVMWRAGITASSASAAWLAARVLGDRRGASTVGMMALTGSQLMQTLVLGGRNKLTIAASLGSFAAVLAIVQTPGLSHGFGCRPLGPIGLAQAGLASTAGALLTVVQRLQSDRAQTKTSPTNVGAAVAAVPGGWRVLL